MIYENGILRPQTPEEIAERERQDAQMEAEARHLPMSEQEAIRHLFQSVPLSPQEAVRAAKAGFYPEFSEVVGQTLQTGYKLTYNGLLYITRQPVTVQAHQPPSVDTAAIYAAIEEEYEGTEYDPIPYRPGMALEQGKHYTDGGGLYLCTRPTIMPVFDRLDKLATVQGGEYVKAV